MELYSSILTTSGFLPDILLFTQAAPILVWFDGTISNILLTMYYSVYVLL